MKWVNAQDRSKLDLARAFLWAANDTWSGNPVSTQVSLDGLLPWSINGTIDRSFSHGGLFIGYHNGVLAGVICITNQDHSAKDEIATKLTSYVNYLHIDPKCRDLGRSFVGALDTIARYSLSRGFLYFRWRAAVDLLRPDVLELYKKMEDSLGIAMCIEQGLNNRGVKTKKYQAHSLRVIDFTQSLSLPTR